MITEYTGDQALKATQETFGTDMEAMVMIEVVDRRSGETAAKFRF